jgi:hypothetical protein
MSTENKHEELKTLSEKLNSSLEMFRTSSCPLKALCWISLILLFVGIIVLWVPCLRPKTWIELVIAVFCISILFIIAYSACQSLYKFLSERQQENKKWQIKIIDAYGKLLEDKLKQQEVSEEEKKKKEERESVLNEKRHVLEMAKLEYEIRKKEYQKDHVQDE